MEILLLTKGYWPLPPMKSLYVNGKWEKLARSKRTNNDEKTGKKPAVDEKNKNSGAKAVNFSVNSHSFSGLIIVEAKLGKALSKKIYLAKGKKKILLSRWIGGLYSNCSTKNVSRVREFYNAIASRYSFHTEPERKAQLATIASSLPKNSLVLDASAGTCLFSEVAKEYGLRTVCMDLSAKMLAQRKDRRAYAIVSSAAKAPFPPSSFDAIVHLFSNLLPYDKTLFPKFRTLLRPHGILLYHPVKSPGEQWLPNWREKTLIRLKDAGFSKVSLRSLPSLGKKKSILTFFWAQK